MSEMFGCSDGKEPIMRIHLHVKTTEHQSPLQLFACHSLIKVSWKLSLVISLPSPQSPGKLLWTRPGDMKEW